MIRKLAFTMYPVSDIVRARAFYEGALGLSSDWSETSPWVEYDLPEGGCLAITTVSDEEPSATAGGTIAFEVADLDAFVEDLKAREVKLVGDLVHGPNCRMMVCLDPDGNSIILHQLNAAG